MVRPSKVGVVVSQGKMDKTVKVRIRNTNWNRHVSKYIVSHKNMLVHDELNKCREGDVVRVQYVRPLSSRKSWAVAEFMRLKGTSWEKYQQEIPNEVKRDEIAKLQEFQKLRQLRDSTKGESPEVVSARENNSDSLPELEVDRMASDVSNVSEQIKQLSFKSAEARRILTEEPERAQQILLSMGKDTLKCNPSMQRNLIRRYLETNVHK